MLESSRFPSELDTDSSFLSLGGSFFASFILISQVCSHCEYSWTIPRPLFGVFRVSPLIFMTVVVLNVFTGASLCLCGCFCIFGGLSTLNCNLAFLCNQCLWSHVWKCLSHLGGYCGCSAISMFILLVFVILLFCCWSIFTVCFYCLVFAFLWQFLRHLFF